MRCSTRPVHHKNILAVALTFACLKSGIAQAQESTAHEPSAAENDSTAEASKQAANPLANAWLMQVQQNTNWIGMPANNGNRVQSNLQFQPLMSVKLSDDWNLITRPIIQMFSTTPFLDQTGQDKRVTAFGDTVLALALSPGPKLVGNWLLAAGPVVYLSDCNEFSDRREQMASRTRRCGWVSRQELYNLRVSATVVLGRR